VVDTTAGPVRIKEIIFFGELCMREILIPLMDTAEYRHSNNDEPISQVASFAPQAIHGRNYSLEMHQISETGETHVILRKLQDKG